jgi:hypothetical protein
MAFELRVFVSLSRLPPRENRKRRNIEIAINE